jgi:hypothetical protein
MKLVKNYAKINVRKVENNFLVYNRDLTKCEFPLLKTVGHSFLLCNEALTDCEFPLLETVGALFLQNNKTLPLKLRPCYQTLKFDKDK